MPDYSTPKAPTATPFLLMSLKLPDFENHQESSVDSAFYFVMTSHFQTPYREPLAEGHTKLPKFHEQINL